MWTWTPLTQFKKVSQNGFQPEDPLFSPSSSSYSVPIFCCLFLKDCPRLCILLVDPVPLTVYCTLCVSPSHRCHCLARTSFSWLKVFASISSPVVMKSLISSIASVSFSSPAATGAKHLGLEGRRAEQEQQWVIRCDLFWGTTCEDKRILHCHFQSQRPDHNRLQNSWLLFLFSASQVSLLLVLLCTCVLIFGWSSESNGVRLCDPLLSSFFDFSLLRVSKRWANPLRYRRRLSVEPFLFSSVLNGWSKIPFCDSLCLFALLFPSTLFDRLS